MAITVLETVLLSQQVLSMTLAPTNRRRLYDLALDQYGYVTTANAGELGVPPVELRKLAQRGGLHNIAYGLYRFDDVPVSGRDQYMEAVLRVGPDAFLTDDGVLSFHDLGLVNPRRIKVGTPRRVRAALPSSIEVVRAHLAPDELTVYEGVPSTTVARALRGCRATLTADQLVDALREARRRGLLRPREADLLAAELGIAA
jgi:predicted transcriptional regulator of viral defense system